MIDINNLIDGLDEFSMYRYLDHKLDDNEKKIIINFETKYNTIVTYNMPWTRGMLLLKIHGAINDFYDSRLKNEEDDLNVR